MSWLIPYFEKNPELAVFLAIGLGYWIGKFKVQRRGLRAGDRLAPGGLADRHFW